MTTLRIMFSVLLLVLVSTVVTAQTRITNDPGVSAHNYKHPHKAKQAARIATTSSATILASQSVQAITDMRQTVRNYKSGSPSGQVNDALVVLPGLSVEYASNPLIAKNNYKRQFSLPVPSKQPAKRQQENLAQQGQFSESLPK